ncbi:hypothetical protein N7G274_005333 [Stereocaulon virgatum]|uniref:Uracil-DNA glycosylase-like domain-containing protein n=1 Tax=Stereocaulon virgatum TaxID=373712 RepID=A0ABR4A9M4_9LECA
MAISSFGGALQQYAFKANPNGRVTRQSCSIDDEPFPTTTAAGPKRKSLSKAPSTQTPSPATSTKRKLPTATASPSPTKKKKRASSTYAPPSKYAHLPNLLTDSLAPNLICVFIGVNPGLRTAITGHAYSHPSNLFWKLCHISGCTPRLCKPTEDHDLPHLYALGHTNIVSRATKDAGELSREEMDEGVEVLEEKCRRWRPESVCIVGKSIWESLWRVRHGRKIGKDEFRYGWQDEGENMGIVRGGDGAEAWGGARVYVATTTSGLAAGMRPHEKEEVWRGLGEWVKKKRRQRGIPDKGGVKEVVAGMGAEAVVDEEVAKASS